jgi:hypothetical protein
MAENGAQSEVLPLPFEQFGVVDVENVQTSRRRDGGLTILARTEWGSDLTLTAPIIVEATPERPLVLRQRARLDSEGRVLSPAVDAVYGGSLDPSCYAPDGQTIRVLEVSRARREALRVYDAELALRWLGFTSVALARKSNRSDVQQVVSQWDAAVRRAEDIYLKARWWRQNPGPEG